MYKAKLAGALALSTILTAGGLVLAAGTSLKFSSIDTGFDSGIDERSDFLIRSQSDWNSFWARHKSRQIPVPPPLKVDFKKDVVIAVMAGFKPSTGYTVKIHSIEKSSKGILVKALLTKPRPDAPAAQMMTQPFDIVRLETVPGELTVQVKEEIKG